MAEVNDLWRECAAWLTRCQVLRQDHKANWLDSSVLELAHTLRDGVLLCTLLNILDPGCIDMKDINQKPQLAQFLCLRNIKVFLQTCREVFGLKESDLFDPPMLFDLSDFYRVLHTLSKLSNCPKAQRKNIQGFTFHKISSPSQEDIYRNLNSNDEDSSMLKTSDDNVEYGSYYSQISDEVYQELCLSSSSNQETVSSHSFEKRDYVINELVETEKNYIDVLTTILRNFMRPLSITLKEEEVRTIFSCIKELSEIHAGFHSQLRKAIVPGSNSKLSEVFLNWREKFAIYGEYCANLTTAQNLIHTICCRDEVINQEIIRCQQEANNGKFKLRDILSVPMQRVLKYHLLLDKLISETQPSHEDYRGLERAKEAMIDVAQYINEVKRDSDNFEITNHIQKSIIDWDMPGNTNLRDYGRLLKDGELRIKAHDDQKIKIRYVFIFDHAVLMCKAVKSEHYRCRELLKLIEYKVDNISSRKATGRDIRWNYQWFMVKKSECTAYTMYARSEDQKRKWVKAIQDALDNLEPSECLNSDHKFTMHTFEKPTTCNQCSKFLKGLIFQGYRCEKCNVSLHKTCIPYSSRCGRPPVPPRPWDDHSRSQPSPLQESPVSSPSTVANLHLLQPDPRLVNELWFVGKMGREQATSLLEDRINGTYLLRIRPLGPTNPDETVYALSLKTDDKVKHMKVYMSEINGVMQIYLSESRYFRSIIELVRHYEQASLAENFTGLDVVLSYPFHKILAIAEYDFKPLEANQLTLISGCEVIVLSKEGDDRGWWKGQVKNKIGFFPKNYVREVTRNGLHIDHS